MKYSYLFGPVPSRRLGLSLGIDLVPLKTCSFNCIYCECGATKNLTISRREYVPAKGVLAELDDFLFEKPELDFITFAGSGEPTLHSRIGDVISFLKDKYPQYKVCVLTNGSLFHLKSVRKALLRADKVIPSLDAASVTAWKKLNRPHPSLHLNGLVKSLETFAKEYKGDCAIELFIMPGINDSAEELSKLKKSLMRISPSSVQLNSLHRPGAEKELKSAPLTSLRKIARFFAPLRVEIAGAAADKISPAFKADVKEKILAAVSRRPLTLEDLASLTGLRIVALVKIVEGLAGDGRVVFVKQGRKKFITRGKANGKQII